MSRFDTIKAVLVRMVLCLHFVIVVWRVTVSWGLLFWWLAAAIIPFILEGLYTVCKRHSIEWGCISWCFLFYLSATLPGIWLLEIHRSYAIHNSNTTTQENKLRSGINILEVGEDTWAMVIEELMLYLMILGRWILPRGGVGREQLSQLLFAFIGIASDIMELFSLFDEDEVRHDEYFTYALLGVWTLSVMQFTLTFHTAYRPSRERGLGLTPPVDTNAKQRLATIRLELLASLLSLCMQDGPFLALRLYTIVTYSLVTYSLIFFSAKNVIVVLLLVYKIIILLSKRFCPQRHVDYINNDYKNGQIQVTNGENGLNQFTVGKNVDGFVVDASIGTDLELIVNAPAAHAKNKDTKIQIMNCAFEDDTGCETNDGCDTCEESGSPARAPDDELRKEELFLNVANTDSKM